VDIRELLHNKWALAGVGVAGAVGVFVWIRSRKAGGGSTSGGVATASPGYTPGGVGSFDTTGTDVAGWLGDYSGNLQGQLDQYQQQLTDTLDQLKNSQQMGNEIQAGNSLFVRTVPWTSPNPAWNSQLTTIASHYGTTVQALIKLNGLDPHKPRISTPWLRVR
jgi:hypothetical protein